LGSFSGGISIKLDTNIHHVKRFARLEVRGQGHYFYVCPIVMLLFIFMLTIVRLVQSCVQICECCNGGGIHFDGV